MIYRIRTNSVPRCHTVLIYFMSPIVTITIIQKCVNWELRIIEQFLSCEWHHQTTPSGLPRLMSMWCLGSTRNPKSWTSNVRDSLCITLLIWSISVFRFSCTPEQPQMHRDYNYYYYYYYTRSICVSD